MEKRKRKEQEKNAARKADRELKKKEKEEAAKKKAEQIAKMKEEIAKKKEEAAKKRTRSSKEGIANKKKKVTADNAGSSNHIDEETCVVSAVPPQCHYKSFPLPRVDDSIYRFISKHILL